MKRLSQKELAVRTAAAELGIEYDYFLERAAYLGINLDEMLEHLSDEPMDDDQYN